MNKNYLLLKNILKKSEKIEEKKIDHVLDWLKKISKKDKTKTKIIKIEELDNWFFKDGKILHKSKQFFSIEGIKIKNAYNREVKNWSQPILSQKHGGYLAIIFKIEKSIPKFLLLARREPGDQNLKLCPSFSATQSNINRAHGGKLTNLYNLISNKKKIFLKTYHYEEGARFYKKINCNLLIKINKKDERFIKDKNFIWLTKSQISKLNFKRGILNPFVKTIMSMII
ncbi:NDP-hexose 2,3-dehydratase family protein [Candidatus Pelagibacter sp.]|uniref:NDP-hexose 2,3-dehydratase family protein n=1 Tax=Candidatus Pelagibacter sp. TaxID=2024849 RepID=UPI003F86F294